MIDRPAPDQREHDEPASIGGVHSSKVGRLVCWNHSIQKQHKSAKDSHGPTGPVAPPLPDQIAAADFAQTGEHKKSDRSQDGHHTPPYRTASRPRPSSWQQRRGAHGRNQRGHQHRTEAPDGSLPDGAPTGSRVHLDSRADLPSDSTPIRDEGHSLFHPPLPFVHAESWNRPSSKHVPSTRDGDRLLIFLETAKTWGGRRCSVLPRDTDIEVASYAKSA